MGKLADGYGALVAEYYHCPSDDLLYVRWHGHLTAAEVVDGFRSILVWQQQLAPRRLLLDRSRTTGEWSEALPWLNFEWLPAASAHGLQAVGYVFSADLPSRHDSEAFLQVMRGFVPVELFGSSHEALAWLCHPHKAKSALPA
ncbi:hypothetical protein DDQ68_21095 [Hymenobacter nivis]|uniref:STAS/SEC14 domain-containing protein n=1 Tax=Hymenobacter nivis TaxID=1850093 RepID=A0A2Z3GMR5_9BACT|nr:hypothetical protein DDQ68_21095 [Hymenobacter nivis]